MIELLLQDLNDYRKSMVLISRICVWLTTALMEREDIVMDGIIVARDTPEHLTFLVVCEDKYHKALMDILFQPPEEFKGKYIASVPCLEPTPVEEKKEEMKDEDEKPS